MKNDLKVDNITTDTAGRAILYDTDNISFGNLYLPSGTDGLSRGQKEKFISEILPMLLVNKKNLVVILIVLPKMRTVLTILKVKCLPA